jgi:hypothetical protein
MQVSVATFVWLVRQVLATEKTSFNVDFDDVRQIIFQAQSDGHITVAEGFEILEAIVSMLMPASPFDWTKGPSTLEKPSQLPGVPQDREIRGSGHD